MRVGIVSIGDYRHITLISKYTSFFKENNIEYDVICTDRYDDPSKGENIFQFKIPFSLSKTEKLKLFLKFYRWTKKIIKKNKYDFLVIWNENTALIFFPVLLGRYRKKYCINIRDVDFLNQRFLNIIRALVIKKSAFSTYCSTAPLDFPHNYQYVLMRSMNLDILKDVPKRVGTVPSGKRIKIVYIGKVRFPEANNEIIEAFGNDNRYEIWFIGAGSEQLEDYKKKYNNLFLIGAYAPDATADYLKDADVINSYFGTSVLGYERMSSIRFSYAPYIHIPVIVGKGTNMEDEGNKYGFAYGFGKVEISDEADCFYKWYSSLDIVSFIEGCENYCSDIRESDQAFQKILLDTIRSINE